MTQDNQKIRENIVLLISNKLQKQMHMIKSKELHNNPKMLCDNLASRVFTVLLENNIITLEDME